MNTSSKKGFTLIELLIVIGILAILTAAVVVILNPAELLKQARDSQRLSDLDALKNAIALYLADSKTFSGLGNTTCYASATGATDCATRTTSATRTTIASSTARGVDGTGWIPLALSTITSGSPLQNLPIDPTNTSAGSLYYSALFDTSALTFELDATLESAKYIGKETTDGGNSTSVYETGSAPGLAL
ncbi:MAG: type II secretion system GspH family protein [Patescibacteria group bacterium]|nr:type II secretion system GspH family protein [Patescibacteria group bacterium]